MIPGSINPTALGGYKEVRRVTKDWDVPTVTWKVPWDKEGGDFSDTISATFSNDQKDVWEKYDVTNLTKEFISDSSGNYGYLLTYPDDPNIDFGNVAYSSEYSDVTKRPKLTIYYSDSK